MCRIWSSHTQHLHGLPRLVWNCGEVKRWGQKKKKEEEKREIKGEGKGEGERHVTDFDPLPLTLIRSEMDPCARVTFTSLTRIAIMARSRARKTQAAARANARADARAAWAARRAAA